MLFPPHARGSTAIQRVAHAAATVSPACAGIDRPYPCPGRRRYRFPRMRGDRPYALSRPDYLIQFPPHARGSTLSRQLRES